MNRLYWLAIWGLHVLCLPVREWRRERWVGLGHFRSYLTLCYVVLCCVMLCYAMLCEVMLGCVVLCYVMLCEVLLCYVMLCYVMLCFVIHWKVWIKVSQCLWLVDRPCWCSPQDCCRLWLTFRQPEWKPSSESRYSLTLKMTFTQVVETSVTTNNSHSQDNANPDDQPTTNTLCYLTSCSVTLLSYTVLLKPFYTASDNVVFIMYGLIY